MSFLCEDCILMLHTFTSKVDFTFFSADDTMDVWYNCITFSRAGVKIASKDIHITSDVGFQFHKVPNAKLLKQL